MTTLAKKKKKKSYGIQIFLKVFIRNEIKSACDIKRADYQNTKWVEMDTSGYKTKRSEKVIRKREFTMTLESKRSREVKRPHTHQVSRSCEDKRSCEVKRSCEGGRSGEVERSCEVSESNRVLLLLNEFPETTSLADSTPQSLQLQSLSLSLSPTVSLPLPFC